MTMATKKQPTKPAKQMPMKDMPMKKGKKGC